MARFLISLTIDADPDGLSGPCVNRAASQWDGLAAAFSLPDILAVSHAGALHAVPVTWFVRADDQIGEFFGCLEYLLHRFARPWEQMRQIGHELGWHPHLYTRQPDGEYCLAEGHAAREQLERNFDAVVSAGLDSAVFRNGEGWHSALTYETVERLGFAIDSTAIPGRFSGGGHPLDWRGAPSQPYYPRFDNLCASGPRRPLLEIPMSTWMVRAPYDTAPRLRYLNPAVHEAIFDGSLEGWQAQPESRDLYVLVLIAHPDDFCPLSGPDHLYGRDPRVLVRNLEALVGHIVSAGHKAEFMTLTRVAEQWKASLELAT
jgi:hypothetical protein